ncbi:MAG: hypothetical protein U0869_12250 [Chloroflexota bacterium]
MEGSSDQAAVARRFRQAIDLMEAGISMQRARLGREHPDAGPDEIRDRLRAWLLDRPGDSDGPSRPIPPEWR